MKKYLIDTNVILEQYDLLADGRYVVCSHVLREIEKHEHSHNQELSYRARQVKRFLNEHNNISYDLKDYTFNLNETFDNYYEDNRIIQACVENFYGLVTNDILLKLKAEGFGIEVIVPNENQTDDQYCGYKDVSLNDAELAFLYEHLNENIYGLLTNEYLIISNSEGKQVDCLKWTGEYHTECVEKNLSTLLLGKFKPMDIYQKSAIDSLLTNDVTLLRGKAGSGKSLIALNYALHQLEKGKIKKLIIFANPVLTKGSQGLGFYKGDKNAKLLQSQVGNLLISKIGDPLKVETMIATGEILMIPFSDIRGFDTGEGNLVWISEAQNLDISLMKLALQRLARGSKMIIDGDDKAQVDNPVFAGNNNGIRQMSKVFRGEDLYGEVEFKTIYRSRVAAIADRMLGFSFKK